MFPLLRYELYGTEMEKGDRRKEERGEVREQDILRSFICAMVLHLAPVLSVFPPRKPFDDSPPPLPIPLRDLRHIAFGMAVRGERERGE